MRNRQLAPFLAVVFAGSMWFYVQRILIPYQEADAVSHGRSRGNFSDLYPRWVGARELLLHHRNPYSADVTREIQAGYYGRALDPNHPQDPKDQQGFAYPVYVAFFLAPTIFFSFPAVQAIFLWGFAVLSCVTVFLWLRVFRWKPSSNTLIVLLLLTLSSFPAVQGIKLQELTLLVYGLLAACVALIIADQLVLAGILLACATFKPQLVVLLVPWLLLWSASEWKTRKRLVVGFGLGMITLLGGAQLVLPGWMGQFYEAVIAYRQYTGSGGSVLEVLLGSLIGKFLSALLVAALALLCWKMRRVSGGSAEFSSALALILTVTVTVIPMTSPYNQILLLPALYLISRDSQRFKANRFASVLSFICALFIIWPWLATTGLSLASLFLAPAAVQKGWAVPLYTSLSIPPAVVVLLVLNGLPALRQSRKLHPSANLA